MMNLDTIIRSALQEDVAHGDITTKFLISSKQDACAEIIVKQDAVVCGLEIAKKVFKQLDNNVRIKSFVKDGQEVSKGKVVLRLKGRAQMLLSAERVALNFLSYLSAIATKTNAFVEAIKPCRTHILDTRKTTPGLRFLERYAVRCGGGHNHRDNLSDMAMIKDNHLLCAQEKSIPRLVDRLKSKTKFSVEVEVDDLLQFQEAIHSRADIILLDNMPVQDVRKAVRFRNQMKSRVLLEVSGGIHLGNVKRYAQTGVERISIGGLTHSRQAIDYSMDIIA